MRISHSTERLGPTMDCTSRVAEEIKVAPPRLSWVRTRFAFLSSATVRRGVVALADQGVVSATNFLTGVIIGRSCIKEEFGLYMLGFSIVLFAMNLQTSLISTPYMIYSSRLTGREYARYTGSTLIHQLGLSALIIIILVIAGVVLSLGVGHHGLVPVVWALVVVITVILLREFARRICFVNMRFKTALFLDSGVAVVQICGLLFLGYFGLLTATKAYWVIGLASGIGAVAWLIRMRKTFAVQLTWGISDFRRNWSSGKWLFASGFLYALSMNLYPWILAAFHGTASAGVWAACFGIVSIGNPLLVGVQNFLGPKIVHTYAQGRAKAFRQFVLKAGAVFSLVITPLFVALLFFGGSLVVIFYGDKYTGNGLVVSILALNLLISTFAFSFSRALFAMERVDVDFAVNFVFLFVLLTLGLYLIKAFGPLGIAFSLLIGNTAVCAFRYLFLIRLSRSASIQKITK